MARQTPPLPDALREAIRQRYEAGEGPNAIARSLALNRGMVYHICQRTERAVALREALTPEQCSDSEVIRRLTVLIRRLEAEDGPLPAEWGRGEE